jgi:alpha-L-rhamnosidase
MIKITDLTCEYFTNPLGIGVTGPRLSWKLHSEWRGARQTACQVRAADNPVDLVVGKNLSWDTGKVASEQSLHNPYGGPALHSGQRVYWQARVWDGDLVSDWSAPAFWEMGLLEGNDWQAMWITPDWEDDPATPQPGPVLRRAFTLDGPVKTARVYVTSLGLYELHLNGQRVGDGLLTPGWTSYDHQLQYQAYDVTETLQAGENAFGVMLGDGWFRGQLGFEGRRNTYGDRLALLLQMHVTYTDGRRAIVASDEGWRATTGPIRMADIYNGEIYDACLELDGWDRPVYEDSAWKGVRRLDRGLQMLVAQTAPLIRRQEEIHPIRMIRSPKGEVIFDFGQNMVGWVRLNVQGPAGTTITLRHAEVLDQEGNFYTENLRAAKQVMQYTLKGAGDEIFEPHFTFFGFRYIAVEGFPGEPALDNFSGIVVHSDTRPTGSFACSNPLINQLQHNIVWGQKSNFVDVPTDCPQRDERLGWTGDTQVFIRTACFNMHVAAFFTKWLRDLKADQRPDGSVPFVIPDPPARGEGARRGMLNAGSSAWSDAAVICPWIIYLCYADKRLLEEQYPSMAGWVNYMVSQADADLVWRKGFHFGDWLDYRGHSPLIPSPVTNNELISTAFFAYSTDLVAQAARELGKKEDAEKYAELAARVKAAFKAEFVSASGRVGPNTQTAYVLALHFDLLPEELRPQAAARLAEEVRKANYHLTTGFVGTPYLCHVLSRYGQTEMAYELLNQESYPSWLYPVKKGATTIWERWDGIKPDGSFQDAGMNSFNHYAYGAIGEWLYRVVAGIEIDPGEPGYKHVLFQPQPGGGLTSARAILDSPYGKVASSWELSEADFRLTVTVPPNAWATVRLPAGSLDEVTEAGRPLLTGDGIFSAHAGDGVALIELGSGNYEFSTTGLNLAKAMAGVRHVAGRLDRYSSLRDLLANEATKAVLVQQLGSELLQAPQLAWVMDAPLDQLARFAPQMLTPEKLDAIGAALREAV